MKLIFCFLIIILATTYAENFIDKEWNQFKKKYNKSYKNAVEEKKRKGIFEKNLKEVLEGPTLHPGKPKYEIGINAYSDLTDDEFFEGLNEIEEEGTPKDFSFRSLDTDNTPIPKSINWVEKGAVTKVKNQGALATCSVFASVGALEGQYFLKNKKLRSFNEQNILDCLKNRKGGNPKIVYEHMKNFGVELRENDFNYKYLKHKECNISTNSSLLKIKDYVPLLFKRDEKQLERAVATIGPIQITLNISGVFSKKYKKGIYYNNECKPLLNHSVLVVGYGETKKGEKYWIIKNSWGKTWGEKGYIRMARGNNTCGIAHSLGYYTVV